MELPIKKQYRIMDMIRNKDPGRKIAKKEYVSPTTVQDYKKRGPPFFRKHSRGTPYNPPPASWLEERDWFIQTIKEQEQHVNYLTGENNRLINDNENLKKEKVTFDQQISQIQDTCQETLKTNAEHFELLKDVSLGLLKDFETVREENNDLKVKELERKKDEDIAKIHSAARATQSSPEDNRKPLQEPVDEDIDAEKENKNSPPWGKIALVGGLAGIGIVLQGLYGGTINNPFSTPSQKVEPQNILYNNHPNQMKNITQPGINDVGRSVGFGPGVGLWILIPSRLKDYIRKT